MSQAVLGGTVFCTKGVLCQCPDDSPKTGTEFAAIAYGRSIVAFTGGRDKATLKWTSQTLKEFCGEPKDKKPDPVPISGGSPNGAAGPHGPTSPPAACKDCETGSTHGDPHIATFDGAFYDLQSAGKFTLAASLDDTLLVQTRQQPLGSSTSVGVNTAAAANLAGDRVGFTSRRAVAALRCG